MDKYTIDLDKLLNDFEYSELTEQQNNTIASSNCQNSNTFHDSYPKAAITSQKHSINNVFHSLNEYLNSDIKADICAASTSVPCLIETDVPVFVKEKIDLPSIQDVFNNISRNDEEEEENEEEEEEVELNNVKTINNNISMQQDTLLQKVVNTEQDVDQLVVHEIVQEIVEELVHSVDRKIIVEPVKFEDSGDLSDTEIENELAELEKEYQDKLKLDNNDDEKTVINSETEIIVVNNIKEETSVNNINEEEEEEIAVKEETINDNKNLNVLRPNSLELNSEQQDNLTINLIGEPGSTPYNNVYVSLPETVKIEPQSTTTTALNNTVHELHAPNVNQTEPDAINNSLSPTLSESSSTYDQSDSPNTSDSCNDTSLDETPKTKRNINKQPDAEEEEEETTTTENNAETANNNASSWLGKTAPFWTPDSDTLCCLHCNKKFTVINRRHHCRACGLVLCSKCSNMKCKLAYMDNQEARVCVKCYEILKESSTTTTIQVNNSSSGSDASPENRPNVPDDNRRLNPNNPMDYCSTVPPLQQVTGASNQPPSVMVPVGVLKRKGSGKNRTNKSVMFMDGIRPGCDLTELDTDFNYKQQQQQQQQKQNVNKMSNDEVAVVGGVAAASNVKKVHVRQKNLPKIDPKTCSYIPPENDALPPIVNIMKSDVFYADCSNNNSIVDMLKTDAITFAIQRNFHIQVKIINMDCCINKTIWCFTTDGLTSVGQDELIILLEFIDNETSLPKDIFTHLNNIFNDAVKGTSITELGTSIHPTSNFLASKNHAGFLYIKPTFQCIQNLLLPNEPYLIGILIHRWETPWAKIFPLRLLLRLGAEYRYYPSPIISTRHRESVYVEIGHTIINLLADFRNFSYTIPGVRGLTIHMEDKNTMVSIPQNRYDQVMKALNNSSEHILAFSANFSLKADSHLVCIQDTHGNNENAYTTHAINIHNKPRKVTGASFIILNGALKSSTGLTAKSSIIEDGLMIHILPEQMLKLRQALKNMKDFVINCGCVNAQSDESVSIVWIENDVNFNVGVLSPIDNMPLCGVPSIRVHNGRDFLCNSGNKMIRWTEVFIIESGEEVMRTQDPIDISKISENISKATSQALVKYLDLLATNSCTKIGIRTTLHIENVSYLAGSNGTKLPPIYMKSLDNELIPVLHKITSNFSEHISVVLELKFHILNV